MLEDNTNNFSLADLYILDGLDDTKSFNTALLDDKTSNLVDSETKINLDTTTTSLGDMSVEIACPIPLPNSGVPESSPTYLGGRLRLLSASGVHPRNPMNFPAPSWKRKSDESDDTFEDVFYVKRHKTLEPRRPGSAKLRSSTRRVHLPRSNVIRRILLSD
jgi:hypothetical protein